MGMGMGMPKYERLIWIAALLLLFFLRWKFGPEA